MQIEAAIPCVEYDDFLRLTLRNNCERLGAVTVLTSPSDSATIQLAERHGAKLLVTDAWWSGGTFNKARALNEWIDQVEIAHENLWLLVLDADILLPLDLDLAVDGLDPTGLYSVRRRMCEDESAWNDFTKERRSLESFLLNVPPVKNGRVWGKRPTSNAAAICGYFHLWNPRHASGMKRFPEMPSAANYDVEFALSFPEERRRFFPKFEALHLGLSKTNWEGRRSTRWEQALSLPRQFSGRPQQARTGGG